MRLIVYVRLGRGGGGGGWGGVVRELAQESIV